MKQAIEQGTVREKECAKVFIDCEDAMAVCDIDQFKRHAGGAFHGIFIAAGRAEAAMTAEGNKLEFTAVRTVPLFDEYDKPTRTMLTSEESFNRSTNVVKDKKTGKPRLLTPIECERIQGFPSDWTKECLVNGEKVEMPANKRRFMMGNALVVNLVNQMEKQLSQIFDAE